MSEDAIVSIPEGEELKGVAWLVFRGWAVNAFSEENHRDLLEVVKSLEGKVTKINIRSFQDVMFEELSKNTSERFFEENCGITIKIAKTNGILLNEIYNLFVIALVDAVLVKLYETKEFYNKKVSDERRFELALRFVMGLANHALSLEHREMMKNAHTRAIKLAESREIPPKGIIDLILASNKEALNYNDFCKTATTIISAFKHGGIMDEVEIFGYFTRFLAYYSYYTYRL